MSDMSDKSDRRRITIEDSNSNIFCPSNTLSDTTTICFYCALLSDEFTPLDVYCFDTLDSLQRHGADKHPDWPMQPGDVDKERYCNELYVKKTKSKNTKHKNA